MNLRTICITAALAAGSLITPQQASANVMKACEPIIQSRCGDVREGRGRIVSCLAANSDQLSGACKASVDAQLNKSFVRNRVPKGQTPLQGTQTGMALQGACRVEIETLCSGVRPEAESILACLYARGDRVGASCQDTADKVLKQLN